MIIEIEHFEENGNRVVKVPLGRSDKKAILYEGDYNDLIALGISPKWTLLHNQVVGRNNNRYVVIARLLRHAVAGQRVVCIDDDATNLRKGNLMISSGPSKFDSRNGIIRPYKDKTIVEHISAP